VTLGSAAADLSKADVSPGRSQSPKNRVERLVRQSHIPTA
jgi:hypothetical protein